jgi:type I restriction enzyme, R subunit
MSANRPAAELPSRIDRLLELAGWPDEDIHRGHALRMGAADYVLDDLCVLEVSRIIEPDQELALRAHLQQAARYDTIKPDIPFLMVSDGELHFIKDIRADRVERLYTLPSKRQLETLLKDPGALHKGYIVERAGLFAFQRDAIAEVVSRLVEGRMRLLLEMATGVGKTVVAAEIINQINYHMLQQMDRRISALFVVDRDALEQQAVRRLAAELPGIKVNTIDQIGEGRVDVVVAQVATLQHRYSRDFKPDSFDLIIVDEAHRSVHGEEWRKIIDYFDCPQIGLTATPPRFDDDETIAYFGEPVFLYSYEDGVRDGILAPCVIHRVYTNIDLHGLPLNGKLYHTQDFGSLVQVDNRDWAIVRYYEKHFYGKKCLVFAASTQHGASLADKFAQMFREHSDGYNAGFIASNRESAAVRRAVVEEFQQPESDLQVLVNLNILTAGFDYPELDLLLMCRYTRHKSLYLQMKGRGSRIPHDHYGRLLKDETGAPVKDRFTMVDFVGVTQWEEQEYTVDQDAATDSEMDSLPELDNVLNADPAQKEAPLVPGADVQVTIEDVQILDPFSETALERFSVRELRVQLNAATYDLARERQSRRTQDERIQTVRHALEVEQARGNEAVWEGFRRMVLMLRTAAPLVPPTEEILLRADSSLADEVVRLSEACGIMRPTLQAHIDAVVAEIPRRRYRELVDREFIAALSSSERHEMERLAEEINQMDAAFYEPLINALEQRLASQRSETREAMEHGGP